MAAEDEKLEIVPEWVFEVPETRALFRLAPAADNNFGRSSRQIAIVAADTEEEARKLAYMQERRSRDDMERGRFSLVFLLMTVSLSQLLEDSFQIAWEYLERTGELETALRRAGFSATSSRR